ncbi:unnamed protein product [Adineta steineri]|uniref:Uncharacterized protein n=1 Tax=Adineta steineri TaxID=433720 RepID=A0A819HHS8_9BILA|nr:unnamed protein product [Adineta steineri]CAF1510781.1 unnamed protein product [Adineta steineri]CAF3900559.1 unnamed protein product [Adineta steineri]CAF4072377.1 unnamed protein product [Adineta steineri]
MLSLSSIIDQFTLACNENNEIGYNGAELYNLVFNYYISLDVINNYNQAVQQLDTTRLNDTYAWLLFTGFNAATDPSYYNIERRDTFCNFWLPKFESLLNKLLSSETNETREIFPCNGIKYIFSNLIRIQTTTEYITDYHIRQDMQFNMFVHRDDYFTIINIVLPLLIDENILKSIENNDHTKNDLHWEPNDSTNTQDITSTFMIWIVLKLFIIFIKTDDDYLIEMGKDEHIKEILLKSIKSIDDDNNNPIKSSLYTILAFLINEDDINHGIDNPKEISDALIYNIKECCDVGGDTGEFIHNGVHINDLLLALKAYSRHDQVKDGFIENDGINTLIKIADPLLTSKETEERIYSMVDKDIEIRIESAREAGADEDMLDKIHREQLMMHKVFINLLNDIGLLALQCLHMISFNDQAKEILTTNEVFLSKVLDIAHDRAMKRKNRPLKNTIDDLLRVLGQDKGNDIEIVQERDENYDGMEYPLSPVPEETYSRLQSVSEFPMPSSPPPEETSSPIQLASEVPVPSSPSRENSSPVPSTAEVSTPHHPSEETSASIPPTSEAPVSSSSPSRETSSPIQSTSEDPIPPSSSPPRETSSPVPSTSEVPTPSPTSRETSSPTPSPTEVPVPSSPPPEETATTIQPASEVPVSSSPPPPRETSSPVPSTTEVPDAASPPPEEATSPVSSTPEVPITSTRTFDDYKQLPIELWSEQHVEQFLIDNKLDEMVTLTESMNGEELSLLYDKCHAHQDYWMMFDRLNNELEKRSEQPLRISVYLRFLNRIQKYVQVSAF